MVPFSVGESVSLPARAVARIQVEAAAHSCATARGAPPTAPGSAEKELRSAAARQRGRTVGQRISSVGLGTV